MAWNDPEIGIQWPQVVGNYPGSASSEGYHLEDGTPLNLSDKDTKWWGLRIRLSFEKKEKCHRWDERWRFPLWVNNPGIE